MDIQHLQTLFEQNQFAQCIKETEQFLQQDPNHIDALLLIAAAYYESIYEQAPLQVYQALRYTILPYLKRVLAQDATHQQAMTLLLNYTLVNDHDLKDSQENKRHISAENKQEFLDYADILANQYDLQLKAYQYKIKIYDLLDEYQDQFKLINEAFNYCDNPSDQASFWVQQIYLRYQYPDLLPQQSVLAEIKAKFNTFYTLEVFHYLSLAEIAYEQKDNALALDILMVLLVKDNTDPEIQRGLAVWYMRFKEAQTAGFTHPDLHWYLVIIEFNYFELLDLPEDTFYHHALELTQKFPQEYTGYHFVSAYFFRNEDYVQAEKFLEKALNIQFHLVSWQRWVMCQYYNYNHFPTVLPNLENESASALYGAGVDLGEYLDEISKEAQPQLRKLVIELYEKSREIFRVYLSQNPHDQESHHCLGMCCNNLAIQYLNIQQYQMGIDTIKEGLEHTEFWELHYTLIQLYEAQENKDQEIYNALDHFFNVYSQEDVPSIDYLTFRNKYLVLGYRLGIDTSIDRIEKALDSSNQLEQYYDGQLDEYNFRDLECSRNDIHELLHHHYEQQPLEIKKEFNASILQKHPTNAWAMFNLMFCYSKLKNHQQVFYYAQQYLIHKPDFIISPFNRLQCHHFSLKSLYLLEDYPKACAYFLQHNPIIYNQCEAGDELMWLMHGIQAFAHCQELEQVTLLLDRIEDLYVQQNWSFDDDLETAYLCKATTLYQAGKLKLAHQQLKEILDYNPNSERAQEYVQIWQKPSLLQRLFGR